MAQPASSPSPLRMGYEAPPPPSWELPDEPVPESTLHAQVTRWVVLLLLAWAARTGRPAKVAPNLALRWLEAQPKVGVDPDLALYEPAPADFDDLTSLCTWLSGHEAPKVALEVVSGGHPYKDYVEAPKKYAASGTGELWVFDPLLAGLAEGGGPHRLQIWARDGRGRFGRVYAGEGPARSPYLGAWLVVTEGGRRLRLSDDPAGRRLWSTAEEAALAAEEAERAGKEAERAAKERALADVVAERAAKEAERAAKEAERAAKEAERAAKEAALAELEQLRAELAALRRGEG